MPAAAAGCGSADRTARTHDTWYARRFFTIPPVSSANGLSIHVLRMMIGPVVGAVADRLVGAQRNADQAGENDGAQGRHDDQNRLLVRHDTLLIWWIRCARGAESARRRPARKLQKSGQHCLEGLRRIRGERVISVTNWRGRSACPAPRE